MHQRPGALLMRERPGRCCVRLPPGGRLTLQDESDFGLQADVRPPGCAIA